MTLDLILYTRLNLQRPGETLETFDLPVIFLGQDT